MATPLVVTAVDTQLGLLADLLYVPSRDVVSSVLTLIEKFLQTEDGSKFGKLKLISCPAVAKGLRTFGNINYAQAFQWLKECKPIRNIVMDVASDEAMWKTFMANSTVQEFFRMETANAKAETVTGKLGAPGNYYLNYEHQSSAEEEKTKAGIWRRIITYLSGAGKAIWKMIENFTFGAVEKIKNQDSQAPPSPKIDDSTTISLGIAFFLSILVMVGIVLLRVFVFTVN